MAPAAAPSVPEVLGRVAVELDIARVRSASLDDMLSELAQRAPLEVLAPLAAQLQAVDLLNQQLQALHGFLSHLAGADPLDGQAIGEAADGITLREVALRLRPPSRVAPTPQAVAGELDLF